MKKTPVLLLTGCLTLGMLSACGSETALLTATDYELDADTNQTSRGISVGDDSEAFLAAYGEYEILTSVDGSDYKLVADEEIPFTEDAVITILPTFFIDGLATDMDQFCKENEIEKNDLLSYLSSEEYLRAHTVVYHYLSFTWENGVIAGIASESMDYNADAAYYNEGK
ncbi:MAG: hypothetical protein J6K48_07255 [Lachnospiraceae bacterium]|nr:hypothetical protein [Lachnospiraceae bacterium]